MASRYSRGRPVFHPADRAFVSSIPFAGYYGEAADEATYPSVILTFRDRLSRRESSFQVEEPPGAEALLRRNIVLMPRVRAKRDSRKRKYTSTRCNL